MTAQIEILERSVSEKSYLLSGDVAGDPAGGWNFIRYTGTTKRFLINQFPGVAYRVPFQYTIKGRAQLLPSNVAPVLLLFSSSPSPTFENSTVILVPGGSNYVDTFAGGTLTHNPVNSFAMGDAVEFDLPAGVQWFTFNLISQLNLPPTANFRTNYFDATGALSEDNVGGCLLNLYGS